MEEVDRVEIERTPENAPSLVAAMVVVIWSEANVTMEMIKRQGGPELDRILDLIERTIRYFSPRDNMLILIEDQVVLQEREQMQAASHSGFAGVSSDECDGWPRIAQLMGEGRQVEIKIGTKDDI
jgi:hypothetical protein